MTRQVKLTMRPDGTGHLMFGSAKLQDIRWDRKPLHKKRARSSWRFRVEILRLREIEAIIRQRFPDGIVPDPEDTDDRETCLAFVRAAALSGSGQDLHTWCRVFAPWVTDADLTPIITQVVRRRRMLRADAVARMLGVTMRERQQLGLRTIGAADVDRGTRKRLAKQRKRERDRERMAEKRRSAGALDRASYEANSLSRLKPWEALGMSRRTWYRRGKPDGTTRSQVDANIRNATDLCQKITVPVLSALASEASDSWGLGSYSPAGCGAEPHRSQRLQFVSPPPPPHIDLQRAS